MSSERPTEPKVAPQVAVPLKGQRLPEEFTITLTKRKADIVGIDVDWGDMTRLWVSEIRPGLIAAWNKENPTQQICIGDAIVQINGIRGDSSALLEEVKNSQSLTLVIMRNANRGAKLPRTGRGQVLS